MNAGLGILPSFKIKLRNTLLTYSASVPTHLTFIITIRIFTQFFVITLLCTFIGFLIITMLYVTFTEFFISLYDANIKASRSRTRVTHVTHLIWIFNKAGCEYYERIYLKELFFEVKCSCEMKVILFGFLQS